MTYYPNEMKFNQSENYSDICPVCDGVGFTMDIKGYCGFETVADLIENHKGLKEDIKRREMELDNMNNLMLKLGSFRNIENLKQFIEDQREIIEQITIDMCAINI